MLLDADLSQMHMLGPAFDVAQDQAMFEMLTLGAVPLWLPLPRNFRSGPPAGNWSPRCGPSRRAAARRG